MKNIVINESDMHVSFRINDDETVELVDFSGVPDSQDMPYLGLKEQGVWKTRDTTRQLISLQLTGHSSMRACKHNMGSDSSALLYVKHSLTEDEEGRLLCIEMKDKDQPGLIVTYYMRFFKGIAAVRTWVTLENTGQEDIGIDYVTSFIYEGLGKNGLKPYYDKFEVYVPRNSWANEAQWNHYDIMDLGLSYMPVQGFNLPDAGNNRFHYGNMGSWSSCAYLPVGIIKDKETGEIYYSEVDFSGSWTIEYGSAKERHLYIALMGPNDESMWWKNVKQGEKISTVPACFGVSRGDVSTAIGELTKYRRAIRRPNKDDECCSVVFNDYMNCLFGDPTEEKEKQIIDIAAKLGCEYYCMDCGWYADGFWFDTIGEWKESSQRFPHGLKTVYDYAHSKGLKMGMWLEIEAMGANSEFVRNLPDDWFVCNHGKRRVERNRYLLDFRNPAVRQYCTDVMDRLIHDYGCEFFKVDYNVTTGPGSDVDTDSRGEANLEHYRALYDWWKEIYRKYPDLVVEACSSGAQRMDYGILELHSLQSTSDQTDVINNTYIAANVVSAVTPEQAGMWVFPYEDDEEHIIYNMVNGILLRPYISGMVWKLSEEKLQILADGIELYKKIRDELKTMTPFFPEHFNKRKAESLYYGLRNEHKLYLAVFGVDTEIININLHSLGTTVKTARVIYPEKVNCTISCQDSILSVILPQKKCARLLELDFQTR